MCTLVSNLRAQKNWFAIQRREWGRGESGRIWIQFPKTASLNVDRQLLGMDIAILISLTYKLKINILNNQDRRR